MLLLQKPAAKGIVPTKMSAVPAKNGNTSSDSSDESGDSDSSSDDEPVSRTNAFILFCSNDDDNSIYEIVPITY